MYRIEGIPDGEFLTVAFTRNYSFVMNSLYNLINGFI